MVLKTDKLSLKLSGEENPLFENVSFTLNKGEIGGISGSAGSGKTMLGLTICGYLPLWISRWELHGAIELLGKPVEQGTFCTEAGIILENPYTQLSGMKRSVRQELAFPLECRGIEPETMEPLIERLSHEFGFAHLLERSVRTLSGGELQRLLIACALIARPRFLFLDRPLTEIDTGFREQLLTTITTHLRENEGAALIAEDPWLLPEQPNIPTAKHLGQAEEKQEITPQEAPSQTKSVQSEADDRHRLSVENLTFAYTPSSPVINNLSFSLSAGELAFVTGPNGAGKTTLAKLITGILKPLSGHILIDNQPIVKKELWEIASLVGLAFQNPGLHLSRRTVREELELAEKSGNSPYEYAEILDIEKLGDHHPLELTQAGKKRLGMALSCGGNRQLIILDEPTQYQDQNGFYYIMETVNHLVHEGRTVIIITHDPWLFDAYPEATIIHLSGIHNF